MVRFLIALIVMQSVATAQFGDGYSAARLRMQAFLQQIERAAAEEAAKAAAEEKCDNPDCTCESCECDPCECRKCDNPNCTCNPCECDPCKCGEIVEAPASPSVMWSEEQPVASPVKTGRRCYMITSESCGPCRRSKTDCGELIDEEGSGSPVEIISIDSRPYYFREMGIRQAPTIPTWIILDEGGREVVRTSGYQSRSSLLSLLSRHNVNANTQSVTAEPMLVATVYSEPSSSALVAAFAEHLSRKEKGGDFPVGGLFDRDMSVPEQVPQILAVLMSGDPIEIEEAGLRITWQGAGREIQFISKDELKLTPSVNVRLEKWKMAVTTTLSGLEISDEGRTVRFILKGPDFTVRFVP